MSELQLSMRCCDDLLRTAGKHPKTTAANGCAIALGRICARFDLSLEDAIALARAAYRSETGG